MSGELLREHRSGESIRLADGADLVLRPLGPDDLSGLRRLHARLSPKTLYQRFMTPVPRLSNRTLAYLADVDHVDREAIVATSGGEIVGEARYHRRPGAAEAEVAIVVEDAWQRRGVGRILLDRLGDRAWRRGISVFTGSMLAENAAARAMLGALFPEAQREVRGSELQFRASLWPLALRRSDRGVHPRSEGAEGVDADRPAA